MKRAPFNDLKRFGKTRKITKFAILSAALLFSCEPAYAAHLVVSAHLTPGLEIGAVRVLESGSWRDVALSGVQTIQTECDVLTFESANPGPFSVSGQLGFGVFWEWLSVDLYPEALPNGSYRIVALMPRPYRAYRVRGADGAIVAAEVLPTAEPCTAVLFEGTAGPVQVAAGQGGEVGAWSGELEPWVVPEPSLWEMQRAALATVLMVVAVRRRRSTLTSGR